MNNSMKCHYCDKTNDLRPYGPKGSMVCFSCAMGSPERKAETERNFAVQLDAAGPMALIDGTEAGPYPAEHNPDAMRLMGHELRCSAWLFLFN
mgnify:CR=1 FL=1